MVYGDGISKYSCCEQLFYVMRNKVNGEATNRWILEVLDMISHLSRVSVYLLVVRIFQIGYRIAVHSRFLTLRCSYLHSAGQTVLGQVNKKHADLVYVCLIP
jgi:hypothetical protein